MRQVLTALWHALPLLFAPRLFRVIALPLIAAIAVWVALAATVMTPLREVIAAQLMAWVGHPALGGIDFSWVVTAGSALVAFVLVTLGVAALAVAAIAVLAGSVMAGVIAARYFPDLERKRGGTVHGSVVNALATLALWVPLALVALPLWLVPVAGIVAAMTLTAWLNQRLFRYDALAEHADAHEMRAIFRSARGRLFLLGLVLAPLSLIPIVNLIAPWYGGLAFTYLCLSELAALRRSRPD